ncbi:MAG: hypothetical protein V8T10_09560 [Merdibacter sp.]
MGRYDIVSFDLFDTLIFRACAAPQGSGWWAMRCICPTKIRRNIERECRQRHEDHEVFLEEIYEVVEQRYRVDKETGMRKELELERAVCFANPYMQAIVRLLQAQGKRIIVTSNMYLRAAQLRELLSACGYELDEIYVSCEHRLQQASRPAAEKAVRKFALLGHSAGRARRRSIIGWMWKAAAWPAGSADYYPNVSELGKPYLRQRG